MAEIPQQAAAFGAIRTLLLWAMNCLTHRSNPRKKKEAAN
jgi:hypothetical protein